MAGVLKSNTDRIRGLIAEIEALPNKWAPIYITAQPQDWSGPAGGGNVYFTVEATGEGLTYMWQVSTDGGATWATYGGTGYQTKTMTSAAFNSRNGNMYRCRVMDAGDNRVFTEAATLTIVAATAEEE